MTTIRRSPRPGRSAPADLTELPSYDGTYVTAMPRDGSLILSGRPRAPRHAAGAHRRIQLGVPIRRFANRCRSSFRPRRFRPRTLIEPAQQAVAKKNLLLSCWEGARRRRRRGVPSGSSAASGELRCRAGPSSLRSAGV
jgi:hypothetical protein